MLQWERLASGEVAGRALHNTFPAARGITGPVSVSDGPYGLDHLVRQHAKVDWSRKSLDVPLGVSIKRHNAEFQSQSAVDGAVELHARGLTGDRIVSIQVDVAQGAYDVHRLATLLEHAKSWNASLRSAQYVASDWSSSCLARNIKKCRPCLSVPASARRLHL